MLYFLLLLKKKNHSDSKEVLKREKKLKCLLGHLHPFHLLIFFTIPLCFLLTIIMNI